MGTGSVGLGVVVVELGVGVEERGCGACGVGGACLGRFCLQGLKQLGVLQESKGVHIIEMIN